MADTPEQIAICRRCKLPWPDGQRAPCDWHSDCPFRAEAKAAQETPAEQRARRIVAQIVQAPVERALQEARA
jgi:hypothetical protein